MSLQGGSAYSGFLHRGCAGITFVSFGSVIVMSINLLFFCKDLKGYFLLAPRLLLPEPARPQRRL
jgi:hypothetical protein